MKISFLENEIKLLEPVLEKLKIKLDIQNVGKKYVIDINEDQYCELSEYLEDTVVLSELDQDYNISPKGIVYERIIDKLYDFFEKREN